MSSKRHRSSRSSRGRNSRRRNQGMRIPKKFAPLIVAGVGGLILAVAALVLATGKSSPDGYVPEYTGGARLALNQDTFDYGDVKLNTTITTDVEISNVGDAPLRITGTPQVQVLEGC